MYILIEKKLNKKGSFNHVEPYGNLKALSDSGVVKKKNGKPFSYRHLWNIIDLNVKDGISYDSDDYTIVTKKNIGIKKV